MEQDIIQERKRKAVKFFKNSQIWVVLILIVALILGIYIRSLPMQDHGGNPGLWDITTNTWTLGPDLDPWLFTRYAKTIVEQGYLPQIDKMRNVPLGFDTTKESRLLPYLIVTNYYILNLILSDANVELAATSLPVIMFALTIISFFLFVREVFVKKSKKSKLRANIIALISTFFMIVIPIFISRTIAGVPEKESAGFFFMFLSFYLFLRAWKSKSLKASIIFAALAAASTAAMGLIWGGVIYVFGTIAIATFIGFILNKIETKHFTAYTVWIFLSTLLVLIFSNRFTLISMLRSLDQLMAFIVFAIILIHFIIWKTKISEIAFLKRSRIPKNMISLVIAIILLIIFASIAFGPSFILEKVSAIHKVMFKPVTGRWNTTVAENRQPYFTEWGGSFGPFIKNIPILFWLFFLGSVVLFKKILGKIKSKDAWILTGFYCLFFIGMVFSRYSSSGIFNGDNFISKAFYYGSAILFLGFTAYYYFKYYKNEDKSFEKLDYPLLFLMTLFLLAIFTVRGAVRLIMVLGPIAPIFVAYLIVESSGKLRKSKDDTARVLLAVFLIIIIILSLFAFWTFYKSAKSQAYNFIPSHYNQQWQKAMDWVRINTAEDAVFSHWWDYGYWVQSIGNRSTVLDGGNAISFWNYYMGRLVLTGPNQSDALEFLYNHDADYLLIDSTDIGKYGAFSSIGSNENFDRFSWFGTFQLDDSKTQETKNQTILFYTGGIFLDEDLIIGDNGSETLLPQGKAGVGAIVIPSVSSNGSTAFKQPSAYIVYNNKQFNVKLRYLYVNGEFIDFKTGVDACAYVMPRILENGGSIGQNPIGSMIFISPRLMRGLFSQLYLLDDPLDNFDNFKLAHTEQNLIIDGLNAQGMGLPDFVFYRGIQGPIKIWGINYTGDEQLREDYIDTDSSKYLDWKL